MALKKTGNSGEIYLFNSDLTRLLRVSRENGQTDKDWSKVSFALKLKSSNFSPLCISNTSLKRCKIIYIRY